MTTQKTNRKDATLWAFYDFRGTGFLKYQDEKGRPVAEGIRALALWQSLGCPTVRDYGHAVVLGLTAQS